MFKANRLPAIIVLFFFAASMGSCGGGGGSSDQSGGSNPPNNTPAVTTTVTGTVSLPAGVSPASQTTVSLGKTGTVSSNGDTTTKVYKEGVTVVAAMTEGKTFGLMNIVSATATVSTSDKASNIRQISAYKASSSSSSIELSPRTTAVSMVFVTPYFATSDPARAASLINTIQNDPKVAVLGNVIESVFNDADPFENPALQKALGEAITSVLNTIQANTKTTSKSFAKTEYSPKVIQLPKGVSGKFSEAMATTYSIDLDYITLNATQVGKSYNINVDSRQGNAVDWLAEIGLLDPSQFASLSDLQSRAADRLSTYKRLSTAPLGRERVSAKGYLRWFDFIGTAMDAVLDKVWGYLFPSGVSISSGVDGVYILRTFNGGGWGADQSERSLISSGSIPNGQKNDKNALMLNISSAVVDTASAVIPLGDYSDCVGSGLTTLMNSSESFLGGSMSISSANDIIVNIVPPVAENFVSGIGSCFKEKASKDLSKFIAKIIKTSAKEVASVLSQYKWFEIAGSVGKVAERATKLYYYETPIESAFVVIGNPFPSPTPTPSPSPTPTPTTLSSPTGLSATPKCDGKTPGIELQWNSVNGATKYEVYRNSSSIYTTTTSTPSFWNASGLTPGQTYQYQVKAKNDTSTSDFSNTATAVAPNCQTQDTTPPSIPTGLSANAVSSTQINLSWNASTDNVGVAGYKVFDSFGAYLKTVSTTSTSFTGLNPNTQYCFTVSAYDAANNESGKSSQQCAITLSNTGSGLISW